MPTVRIESNDPTHAYAPALQAAPLYDAAGTNKDKQKCTPQADDNYRWPLWRQ
jgi:hypothetical protein